MQDQELAVLSAILYGLIGNNENCILFGCEQTIIGNNISFSSGYIFMNGEIFSVPAVSFNSQNNQNFYFQTNFTTSENRAFKDTSNHDVWALREMQICQCIGNIPAGTIYWGNLDRLTTILSNNVQGGASEQLTFIQQTFNIADLVTPQQFIPAPGAGKMIKVVSCSSNLVIILQLKVGTQNINIGYTYSSGGILGPSGGQAVNADIGYIPNSVVQCSGSLPYDMKPGSGVMAPNAPVMISLSGITAPTLGSGTITFYCLYKTITL
jgi:hypothetical protein